MTERAPMGLAWEPGAAKLVRLLVVANVEQEEVVGTKVYYDPGHTAML